MVEDLGPCAVDADVVGGPTSAEVGAQGGQLADELSELLVVRHCSGLGAEHLHARCLGLVLIQAQCTGECAEDFVGDPTTSINSKLAISRERLLCYLSTGAPNG